MNLGAIIRTSYYLGVDKLILSSDYPSARLSPTVSKASAGVLEVWPPINISGGNMLESFLERKVEQGWEVVGASNILQNK